MNELFIQVLGEQGICLDAMPHIAQDRTVTNYTMQHNTTESTYPSGLKMFPF